MPDSDNAGAEGAAPDAGAAGVEQNPLEGAAAASGGDGAGQNPLENAAAAAEGGAKGDEAPAVPDKFKNEDGSLNNDAMMKSYGELEKQFSTMPRAPKTVEEYNIDYGELPEGVEINKETEGEFLKECLELGVSNDIAQHFLRKHIADTVASAEVDSGKTDCIAELKKEWGEDYGKNSAIAHKAYLALATQEMLADPESLNKVGNNPLMVRLLAEAGKNLGEDVLSKSAVPGESQQDIDSLMKSDAYRDPKHPDNAKTKERVKRYFEKKYPAAG